MSSISVGTTITAGPVATSLQPRQRVLLKYRGGEEMVTVVSARPLGRGKYSVVFMTDTVDTFRMEYTPSSGTGSVVA
jgi:hypothetical protein